MRPEGLTGTSAGDEGSHSLMAGRFQTARKEQLHSSSTQWNKTLELLCKKEGSEGTASKQVAVQGSPAATVQRSVLKRPRGSSCTHKNGIIKSLQSFILLIKATPQ